MRRHFLLFARDFPLASFLLARPPFPARAQDMTPMAVFSPTDSMKELPAAWAAHGHPAPRFVFAASSVLAQQAGARGAHGYRRLRRPAAGAARTPDRAGGGADLPQAGMLHPPMMRDR